MNPKDYIDLFKKQQEATTPVTGICTRIIRIGNASHRLKLSGDDPNRKIVFVSNASSSAKLLGKDGYECLIQIGYPKDWILNDLLPPGPNQRTFEMIVFPETSCVSAKWDNFLDVVSKAYPDVSDDCSRYLEVLKENSIQMQDKGWSTYNETLGYDIGQQKKGSDTYMTLDHYLSSLRDVAHFRAFLAHSCYANKNFSGDGWTHDDNGDRQAEEFVMADAVIDDIDGVARCDMEVVAPNSTSSAESWICCIN
jgi:hypothetical protein